MNIDLGTKVVITTFTEAGTMYDETMYYSKIPFSEKVSILDEAIPKVPQKGKDFLVESFDGKGAHNKVLVKKI